MSHGATARLFVAVDPPPHAREELARWARAVAALACTAGGRGGGLRLLEARSLHLTLCFLGSRPVAEIEALSVAVGDCAELACELSVGAPLWLPPRHARALAVEVHDPSRGLARVQERVSGALASASSWEPERRRFRPHITLARLRHGASATRRRSVERPSHEQPLPATPRLEFAPEQVVLYRSWLAPTGATYEALASSELTPASR